MARKTNIEDFHKITAKIQDVEKTVKEYTEFTAERLTTEPTWKRNRRSNTYNQGWRGDMVTRTKTQSTGWVHNATNWQLTWLLENGHLVTNKKGGVGWASPHRHIKPIFQEESENFVDDMRNLDIKVEIK